MNKKSKIVSILIIIMLFYFFHINSKNEITSNYPLVYVFLSLLILLPISVMRTISNYKEHQRLKRKIVFSRKKREQLEKELGRFSWFEEIITIIFLPIMPIFIVMPMISYHYTYLFGIDTRYVADVIEKEMTKGKYSHYYTYIKSSKFGVETLDSKNIYDQFPLNSQIIIYKRESFLGEYIEHNRVLHP